MSLSLTLYISHVIVELEAVDFEQENVCLESLLWISIYPRAELRHRSTVFISNFEHISHLDLVLLLLILSMYLIVSFDTSCFSRF